MHKDIAVDLTKRLVNAYQQVAIGDPADESKLMGPLVNPRAVEDMFQALEHVKEQGGEILAGGKKREDIGPNFVEPTIVKMPAQTEIIKEETFAPILYLLEYSSLDEAIAIVREAQDLTAGVREAG